MTKHQRLILFIAILASFLTFLDGSVVSVALPAISAELGGGLALQQWVNSAYFITLGALILVAGSLSDLFGRKNILVIGVVGFSIASILCAIAPSPVMLVIARALQGVFGALLVPSSLALIISWFDGEEQGKAIGSWTAWTGMSFIIGPLVGGILVDALSWRWIFFINVIPSLITLFLLHRLPSDKPNERASVDFLGAFLCTVGLGTTVFGLIEQPTRGWEHPLVLYPLIIGILFIGLFIFLQQRIKHPMLPLSLFKVRNFSVGNLATAAIYGGLSLFTFLMTIFVQQVGNFSAVGAGLAVMPVTVIMFFLSSRFGALAGKYGPRLFMALGPIIASIGFITLLSVDARVDYVTQILPGVLLFGLGLSMTVAPLTSAVLGDISKKQAGIGSAVNNAISRISSMISVAAIGLIVGASITLESFHQGVLLMALLLAIGGAISAVGIRNQKQTAR
jgi:EmrB/QacA subfamily drug resistance transporter